MLHQPAEFHPECFADAGVDSEDEIQLEVPHSLPDFPPVPVPVMQRSNGLIYYGRIAAHYTHRMASSSNLHLHFCTRCGAWGKVRSVNLKGICEPPTPAGKWALNRIAAGKMPG